MLENNNRLTHVQLDTNLCKSFKSMGKTLRISIIGVRVRRFQPHLSPVEIAKNKFN